MAQATRPKNTKQAKVSPALPANKAGATKKAPAKAPPAKQASAKKAVLAKKTPSVKQAPAKKAVAVKQAPVKQAPAKTAPAKKAPAKKAPAVKQAPAKKAPAVKKAPVKSAPVKSAPVKSAPVKSAPVKSAPVKSAPVKSAPVKSAPVKSAPVKQAPVKQTPAVKKPARKPTTVICPLSGFVVKPEKPGLSPRTIERLHASLLEERARHLQSAADLAAEAEQLAAEREGGDTQFDEESGEGDTINIERERDLLLSAGAQQIVDEIDRALARIANGTYGLCLPAGRRITLERLEALPYAETCVDCKARAERRR